MAPFRNHYRVLNVEPTADDATIKTAFRRLARRYHPDLAKTARAARKFQEIREAYDVLSDSEKRRRYDELYRTQTALRPVAAGRNRTTIKAQARAGSAGLGISLDVLGVRVGLAVDAQLSRRPAAPTQTARRKGPPRRQARDR